MTSDASPTSPRRHAPAHERRAQILAAAMRCFAERGYHATTMDHLVRASGLSKGSLYWHFASKLDVFLALFDAFAAEIFQDWDAAAAGGADALGVLRHDLVGTLDRLLAERELVLAWAEFLALPEGRARMAAVYRASRAKLAETLRRGIERGELRALDPEAAAAALVGLGEGLALQVMVDPDFELEARAEALWSLIEGGLSP